MWIIDDVYKLLAACIHVHVIVANIHVHVDVNACSGSSLCFRHESPSSRGGVDSSVSSSSASRASSHLPHSQASSSLRSLASTHSTSVLSAASVQAANHVSGAFVKTVRLIT